MDFIQSLAAFRTRNKIDRAMVQGRTWGVLDSGGDGPALVLLPGTLGSAEIFWHQFEGLKDRFRVIALTYAQVASVPKLVQDLERLLDRLGVDQAAVLGSSFGGVLAQAFAAARPARVDHLFIANSLHDIGLVRPAFPKHAMLLAMPAALLRRTMRGQIAAWPENAPGMAGLKALLLDELDHHLPPRAPKLRLAALLALKSAPKADLPADRITVIDSTDDPLIPAAVRENVCGAYPDAHHHRFETGGHFPYVTRADDYNALLVERLT